MRYGPVVPTLKVASISSSLDFYTGVLDFQLKWSWASDSQFQQHDAEPEFACIECGETVLFISQLDGGMATKLFVELPFVEDVDALAARIGDDAPVLDRPEDREWGSREFTIADPDGHQLRFSCPTDRSRQIQE